MSVIQLFFTVPSCENATLLLAEYLVPLGTIKASQVVVLNEDMKLLLNENLCRQRDPHLQIKVDFVEKHIH